jgi:hypothetical protein
MSNAPSETKTDRLLEDRMLAAAGDPERVAVIERARAFKRSWIELAEALSRVAERGAWKRWGHDSFDAYVKAELAITPATASKLLGSFRFLKVQAPKVIERAQHEPNAPVPSLRAVDFVARATERGAADPGKLLEIQRAAFEDGVEAPLLTRRFKSIAFPVADGETIDRLRVQIASTARKLASLIAEPNGPVPRGMAADVEAMLGELLVSLEAAAA